jgi:trehalose-6-phosphate synthase
MQTSCQPRTSRKHQHHTTEDTQPGSAETLYQRFAEADVRVAALDGTVWIQDYQTTPRVRG